MSKNRTALQIILKKLNPSNQARLYERKSLCEVDKKNNKWKEKKNQNHNGMQRNFTCNISLRFTRLQLV